MHQLNDYDLLIFDCDGVILDSNGLKLSAMEDAVFACGFSSDDAAKCKAFFINNFGRSRFYHVTHFVNHILDVKDIKKAIIYHEILEGFSSRCSKEYENSQFTANFEVFFNALSCKKAVASGSEQEELRRVLRSKNIAHKFEKVFGSPTSKNDNVFTILKEISHRRAALIGDSVADLDAAVLNNIDFIAYTPYSNVPEKISNLCKQQGFHVLSEWPTALGT
ncbi:HAD family hydrolase [Ningiella sp. W23]|uniref:HAD family hydrolase n=1 Tax=Ningiella sp. W23 TaxID=3023715 RepID=UPI0037573394